VRASDLRHRQVVVVGSGFGGAMAALPLVRSGLDVLMLERGPWIPRGPQCWAPEGTITRTPYYESHGYALARTDAGRYEVRSVAAVGGPSVFYGAVAMRMRESDFLGDPEIVTDSGAEWPIRYADLRPYYDAAERTLRVAGEAGGDPTEPPRSEYPARLNGLSPVSRAIASAARSLGLHPFRLPLAINFRGHDTGQNLCAECATCDTFACAIEAKNDLATVVLSALAREGLEIRAETSVTRLHVEGNRVVGVECLDRGSGSTYVVTADTVVLAAGALGTPHVILSSGLDERSPAGDVVGRYLTRHCCGIVFGGYSWIPRHEGVFHKQIGITDFYLGDPSGEEPRGKLGSIQQTQTPHIGQVVGETGPIGFLLTPLVRRATGLLVIAEDRPRYENRVHLAESAGSDGRRLLSIEHHYDARDLASRKRLYSHARQVHRAAGALLHYVHNIQTFSHALGTVRMGRDPERAPLDASGRFRGVDNLYVTDGSALPTSGAVNPSLTIAANALRIGCLLAQKIRTGAEAVAAR